MRYVAMSAYSEMVMPPSTISTCPVQKDEAGDAK
jgi:hypothetical protein